MNRTRKKTYTDLAEAYQHAYEIRSLGNYRPYRCECKKYHVGRIQTNPFKIEGRKGTPQQTYDEILVGKLIGALKKAILEK